MWYTKTTYRIQAGFGWFRVQRRFAKFFWITETRVIDEDHTSGAIIRGPVLFQCYDDAKAYVADKETAASEAKRKLNRKRWTTVTSGWDMFSHEL